MATKWLCVPFLQNKCNYAGERELDFQNFIYVKLKKKKKNDKHLKKIGELFLGLIFQQIYYSIKAIPPPPPTPASRLACQGGHTYSFYGQYISCLIYS